MSLAWHFGRKNGYSVSKVLKIPWRNIKLKAAMKNRIVKFYFCKVDGSTREAYGTLADKYLPETKRTDSKPNDTTQTYFDAERGEYSCFKKANLISIV